MKRKWLRMICAMVLAISCMCTMDVTAEASNVRVMDTEEPVVLEVEVEGMNRFSDFSTYATVFDEASVSVVYDRQGMHIDICTTMNGVASVVGVKDIEIQRKTWYGWTTVATASGGESRNVTTCVCTLHYHGTVAGESYRVVRTHYGNVDGYRELQAETGPLYCDTSYGG